MCYSGEAILVICFKSTSRMTSNDVKELAAGMEKIRLGVDSALPGPQEFLEGLSAWNPPPCKCSSWIDGVFSKSTCVCSLEEHALLVAVRIRNGLSPFEFPIPASHTDLFKDFPGAGDNGLHCVDVGKANEAKELYVFNLLTGATSGKDSWRLLRGFDSKEQVWRKLDLRNMFIDSSELEAMPMMRSFTMRCVKVTGDTLQLVNTYMRNLTTLVLLGVFGVTHGSLDFPYMKVLCLGPSTMAKDVSVQLPSLEKLQLKMQCPESLIISASGLKYMAFNLEVGDTSKVDLKNRLNLQELLYGISSFDTLLSLVAANVNLEKIFLDIPCMAPVEDGRWLGVLKGIPFNLPDFNKLLQCQKLEVLNIGPGLWYSMEVNVDQLSQVEKWPPLKRLILHMIPQNLNSCLATLHMLLKPTLASLEIYVHTNSPISYETIVSKVREIVSQFGRDFAFKPRHWTRSLDFSCFSF